MYSTESIILVILIIVGLAFAVRYYLKSTSAQPSPVDPSPYYVEPSAPEVTPEPVAAVTQEPEPVAKYLPEVVDAPATNMTDSLAYDRMCVAKSAAVRHEKAVQRKVKADAKKSATKTKVKAPK